MDTLEQEVIEYCREKFHVGNLRINAEFVEVERVTAGRHHVTDENRCLVSVEREPVWQRIGSVEQILSEMCGDRPRYLSRAMVRR